MVKVIVTAEGPVHPVQDKSALGVLTARGSLVTGLENPLKTAPYAAAEPIFQLPDTPEVKSS